MKLSFFSFTDLVFVVIFENSSPNPKWPRFPSMIFSRSLLLLHFTFRSVMCFEVFFVKRVKSYVYICFVCVCVCLWISIIYSTICLKDFLFIWIAFPSLSKFSVGLQENNWLSFNLEMCLLLKKNYLFYLFIWLLWVFVAVRGLLPSCGERGLLFVAVCGLLIAVTSLVVEHGL